MRWVSRLTNSPGNRPDFPPRKPRTMATPASAPTPTFATPSPPRYESDDDRRPLAKRARWMVRWADLELDECDQELHPVAFAQQPVFVETSAANLLHSIFVALDVPLTPHGVEPPEYPRAFRLILHGWDVNRSGCIALLTSADAYLPCKDNTVAKHNKTERDHMQYRPLWDAFVGLGFAYSRDVLHRQTHVYLNRYFNDFHAYMLLEQLPVNRTGLFLDRTKNSFLEYITQLVEDLFKPTNLSFTEHRVQHIILNQFDLQPPPQLQSQVIRFGANLLHRMPASDFMVVMVLRGELDVFTAGIGHFSASEAGSLMIFPGNMYHECNPKHCKTLTFAF